MDDKGFDEVHFMWVAIFGLGFVTAVSATYMWLH